MRRQSPCPSPKHRCFITRSRREADRCVPSVSGVTGGVGLNLLVGVFACSLESVLMVSGALRVQKPLAENESRESNIGQLELHLSFQRERAVTICQKLSSLRSSPLACVPGPSSWGCGSYVPQNQQPLVGLGAEQSSQCISKASIFLEYCFSSNLSQNGNKATGISWFLKFNGLLSQFLQ